jgi:hypothetical protein
MKRHSKGQRKSVKGKRSKNFDLRREEVRERRENGVTIDP